MSEFYGERLFLSQSFRFGQSIADVANQWLTNLNADLRLKGCEIESTIEDLNRADAILCRTNGKCIEEVSNNIDMGRKVSLVGGGESIKKMAEASITLKAGIGTSHPEFFTFKTWQEVQEYSETDEGGDIKPFVKMIDKYGSDGVIDICNSLSEERNADVVVSTCHKAKGREWGSVKISDDFIEPQKSEKKPNPKIDRSIAMLAYVAVTRAKSKLDCSNIDWISEFI